MRHSRCFLILLLMAASACRGLSAEEKSSEYWAEELERGYRAKSPKPLIAFLDAWHEDSKPTDLDTLKRKLPFEQDVYEVYYSVFSSEKKSYEDAKYVILRDEINVVVADSDMRNEFTAENHIRHDLRLRQLAKLSEFDVKNFRPPLQLEGKKVLFLQPRYLAQLAGFVTQDKNPLKLLERDRYQLEENKSDERQKRLAYLNAATAIKAGFMGRGWDFETYPIIHRVYFSSNFKRAIVRHRVGSELGEVLLEKQKEHFWMIVQKQIYGVI